MLSNMFFVLIVMCLTAVAMLAASYDRDYKTLKMLDIPVFTGLFLLFMFLSFIFTAILFQHPLVVLSIVGMLLVIGGMGVVIYRGILYLKNYLDARGK